MRPTWPKMEAPNGAATVDPAVLSRLRRLLGLTGSANEHEAAGAHTEIDAVLSRRGLALRELPGDARFTAVVAREASGAEILLLDVSDTRVRAVGTPGQVTRCLAAHALLIDEFEAAWRRAREPAPVQQRPASMFGTATASGAGVASGGLHFRVHGDLLTGQMSDLLAQVLGGTLGVPETPRPSPEDRDAFMVGLAQESLRRVVERRGWRRPLPRAVEEALGRERVREECQRRGQESERAGTTPPESTESQAPERAPQPVSREAREAARRRQAAQERAHRMGREAAASLRTGGLVLVLRDFPPALPAHVE